MPYPNLSSELLRTFVTVVEQDGFIRAAQLLHKTQSAVSQQMKKLEQEVDVDLFKTIGRKRVLTPEGDMMLGYARQLLALQDDAIANLQHSRLSGRIRIGVDHGLAELKLPQILADFVRQNPDICLSIESADSQQLNAAFDQGDYDLVVTVALEQQGQGELLRSEPLVWVGAQGWQWPQQQALPIATCQQDCLYRDACLGALQQRHIPWRIVCQPASHPGVLAAVRSGLAIAVLPASAVTAECEILNNRLSLPLLAKVNSHLRYRSSLPAGRVIAESLRQADFPA